MHADRSVWRDGASWQVEQSFLGDRRSGCFSWPPERGFQKEFVRARCARRRERARSPFAFTRENALHSHSL